nr:MAG TPA: hypothetical protein [Caudoviricetes sp.]
MQPDHLPSAPRNGACNRFSIKIFVIIFLSLWWIYQVWLIEYGYSESRHLARVKLVRFQKVSTTTYNRK